MNPRSPLWSILKKKKKLHKAEPITADVHINRIYLVKKENRLKDISGLVFEIRLKAGMTSFA